MYQLYRYLKKKSDARKTEAAHQARSTASDAPAPMAQRSGDSAHPPPPQYQYVAPDCRHTPPIDTLIQVEPRGSHTGQLVKADRAKRESTA